MNILIIETDGSVRRSLSFALALRGHVLIQVSSAQELRERCQTEDIPLVIIGQPPPGDGTAVDLCRDIRQLPGGARATVLVLTPSGDPDAIIAALDAGANGYLTHPIDAEQVRDRLEGIEREVSSADVSAPEPQTASREQLLIDQVVGPTLIIDPDGAITWANPAVTRLLDQDPERLIGTSVFWLCHPDDASTLITLLADVTGREGSAGADVRMLRRDGTWLNMDVRAHGLQHDPTIGGIILLAHDVTERTAREDLLRRQTLLDEVTGLPNRLLFMSYVERTLARSDRRGEPTMLAIVDLDDFQRVNARYGRGVGDAVLAMVAERLVHALRATDAAARLANDEFAIQFDNIGSREVVEVIGDRLLDVLHAPFEIVDDGGAISLTLTSSIGLAFSLPGSATESRESRLDLLLRHADLALYQAKAAGKGRWVLYEEPGTGSFGLHF
jgi:diguanylate cyclase (GGDEF)-like protein/PAS domain S-box-containing protein